MNGQTRFQKNQNATANEVRAILLRRNPLRDDHHSPNAHWINFEPLFSHPSVLRRLAQLLGAEFPDLYPATTGVEMVLGVGPEGVILAHYLAWFFTNQRQGREEVLVGGTESVDTEAKYQRTLVCATMLQSPEPLADLICRLRQNRVNVIGFGAVCDVTDTETEEALEECLGTRTVVLMKETALVIGRS